MGAGAAGRAALAVMSPAGTVRDDGEDGGHPTDRTPDPAPPARDR